MKLSFGGKARECISRCIKEYKAVVGEIDADAASQNKRAYGGKVRMAKGALGEYITQELLRAAWMAMGKEPARLEFVKHKYDIPIRPEYVKNIKDANLREEILGNMDAYKTKHGTDVHVHIDGKFVLSVECKAYTENAMLKRILFDAFLLQQQFPNLRFALVQMENQMGGDYGNPGASRTTGSRQSHTLMSYMDSVDLHIITLLEGERKINRPIHKAEFYKPLKRKHLEKAATTLATLLTPPQ